LNPGLHSQSCLWCIYCKAALMQTWKLDNSSFRWGGIGLIPWGSMSRKQVQMLNLPNMGP
jgi:hypothetical protein